MTSEYNKELILAHQFLKTRYQTYLTSNRIKSNQERRAYAHAIQIIGDIAYNTNITPKPNPNTYKKQVIIPQHMNKQKEEEEETTTEEHTELYNMATTD